MLASIELNIVLYFLGTDIPTPTAAQNANSKNTSANISIDMSNLNECLALLLVAACTAFTRGSEHFCLMNISFCVSIMFLTFVGRYPFLLGRLSS